MRKILFFIIIFIGFNTLSYTATQTFIGENFLKFNSKAPVEISSDKLEIDNSKDDFYIFYYKKNVVLVQGDAKVYSDFMKIYYDKKSKKIIKVDIIQNVKIKTKDTICTCDNGKYFVQEGKIYLKNNVKIMQGGNIFYGDALDIDLINNKSILKGRDNRIRTIFPGSK